MYWNDISVLETKAKIVFAAKLWDSKNFWTTQDKSWKLEVESFAKLCWLVLWTDQVLAGFDKFEIF